MGGTLGFIAVIAMLGLWGMMDFDSLFTLFHKLLFTNDLWLLDPRTDLLIRICPSSMFMNMGARIGIFGLIWVLAAPLLVSAAVYAIKERG